LTLVISPEIKNVESSLFRPNCASPKKLKGQLQKSNKESILGNNLTKRSTISLNFSKGSILGKNLAKGQFLAKI